MNPLVDVGPALGIALLLLLATACAFAAYGRLCLQRDVLVACLRAAVQLGLVAIVIATVVRSVWLSLLFVLAMFVVASGTAGRRLVRSRCGWWCAVPVGTALPVTAALVALGVVPARGVAIVPVAGILIGGAMAAAGVTGRRLAGAIEDGMAGIETRLALGVGVGDALAPLVRDAATTGLIPVLDQTKNVGLVTLPGTFVGLILGGASPAEAARVQLTVLLALLAVQIVAALVVSRLVTAALTLPGERVAAPGKR